MRRGGGDDPDMCQMSTSAQQSQYIIVQDAVVQHVQNTLILHTPNVHIGAAAPVHNYPGYYATACSLILHTLVTKGVNWFKGLVKYQWSQKAATCLQILHFCLFRCVGISRTHSHLHPCGSEVKVAILLLFVPVWGVQEAST